MEQVEFERAVLHMAHHGPEQRLTPTAVGYQLGLSVKDAERMLDKMVTNAHMELDSDDSGNLFYFVPGVGTPGIFTAGTAAANPVEAPVPPPGPSAAPYAQQPPHSPAAAGGHPGAPYGAYAPPTAGAPGGQYGQPYHNAGGNPAAGGAAPPYGAPQPGWRSYQHPLPNTHRQPGQPYPPTPQPNYGPSGGPAMPGAPAHVAPGGYPPTGPSGPPPMGTPFGQPHHAQQPYAYGQNALVSSRPVPGKSPATAAVLSTFFPGAGQLYNGQVGKGLVVFFGFMFLAAAGPLALVPWLWGISDAHKTSKQQSAAQHYGLLGP